MLLLTAKFQSPCGEMGLKEQKLVLKNGGVEVSVPLRGNGFESKR